MTFGIDLKNHLFDFVWASSSVINKSASISLIGFLAFQFGYFSSSNNFVGHSKNKSFLVKFYEKRGSDIILICTTYALYFLFLFIDDSYRGGSYQLEEGIGGYFFLIFNIMLTAIICIKLLRIHNTFDSIDLISYINEIGLPVVIISFWHILFSLYIGDRGPVISYSLLLFGLFFFKYFNLRFIFLILIVIFGATFLTIVGKARRVQSNGGIIAKYNEVTSQESLSNRFETSVPLEQTVELALSIRCLNHAILNVPSDFSFKYGFFQIKQLFSIIPGGSSFFLKLTDKGYIYDGSANYITYLIQGENPLYGDGTTVAADLYLDFGAVGVFAGMFVFGFLIYRGEFILFNNSKSLFYWLFILIYFSFSLYIARSSLLFNFKIVIIGYLILYVNYIVILFNEKKGSIFSK
ncbi:O-antigen polysaccharide polymerase Wzy [Cyclobacterium roseum]|uniref:O-antigen polysaccharide polymerase Wzy n=1 Tax=Cyclobacterium roseum TaxID=2666137 RepID=UPI001391768C|nr:O-antigen polysaccharide polymerase Wzy [Cyclobacterium roseum]